MLPSIVVKFYAALVTLPSTSLILFSFLDQFGGGYQVWNFFLIVIIIIIIIIMIKIATCLFITPVLPEKYGHFLYSGINLDSQTSKRNKNFS